MISNQRSLKEIANELALQAKNEGCRGIIIALSKDEPAGIHSKFHVEHIGPCLELEGLSNRIVDIIGKLWIGLIMIKKENKGNE